MVPSVNVAPPENGMLTNEPGPEVDVSEMLDTANVVEYKAGVVVKPVWRISTVSVPVAKESRRILKSNAFRVKLPVPLTTKLWPAAPLVEPLTNEEILNALSAVVVSDVLALIFKVSS